MDVLCVPCRSRGMVNEVGLGSSQMLGRGHCRICHLRQRLPLWIGPLAAHTFLHWFCIDVLFWRVCSSMYVLSENIKKVMVNKTKQPDDEIISMVLDLVLRWPLQSLHTPSSEVARSVQKCEVANCWGAGARILGSRRNLIAGGGISQPRYFTKRCWVSWFTSAGVTMRGCWHRPGDNVRCHRGHSQVTHHPARVVQKPLKSKWFYCYCSMHVT